MNFPKKIDQAWSQLDPIFIMGMQRSGTSILAIALSLAEYHSFGEGHLWFEILKPFDLFRNPAYYPKLKQDVFALGQDRNLLLEKYVALAIDRFHRDNLPDKPIRWADKSPGAGAVKSAPLLAELFPKSQFIFVYRNGIATINSGMNMWPDRPSIFETMCRGWTKSMSAWRRVRTSLEDRYLEIRQEEIARDPAGVAQEMTTFLDVTEKKAEIAELFGSMRANTSFPDRSVGDYAYEIDWSDEQKAFFAATCGAEMKAWGYEIDFDTAGLVQNGIKLPSEQPAVTKVSDQRDARIVELEHECQALREHLRQIKQGRVMRLLNWLNGVVGRFKARRSGK